MEDFATDSSDAGIYQRTIVEMAYKVWQKEENNINGRVCKLPCSMIVYGKLLLSYLIRLLHLRSETR